MKNISSQRYSIQLSFEEIRLPPFEDILVLGKKCSQGKVGVVKSFEFLAPNEFELFEMNDAVVEAVFINRRVLKKIDKDIVIKILKEKIFPFVSECEIIKVNFRLRISDTIEGEF